ncbi:MAG: hypothetical protein QOE36_2194, partial [Gaiellaceae bacterium]|nr:hypothetical protein [Gaiellaceae bacterium]
MALTVRVTGRLPQPVQDAAAARVHGGAMLLGGLTAADTSTDRVLLAGTSGGRLVGHIPGALHDAAAAGLGGAAYLFGGGNGTAQLDQILRVGGTGAAADTLAGRLPAPSSDQVAAAAGGTAYVVGGYTGTRWLDTIVAWRPGRSARVVAHLPFALRYAAVTAVGNRLIVAGGSKPDGTASDLVLEYVPSTRRVIRIGRLPAPTTHAAAATLGGTAFVFGGRGAASGTPTSRIVAVDVGARRVRAAGRLPSPTSDLAAVSLGSRILLAGGRTSPGTVSTVLEARPRAVKIARVARPAAVASSNVYAADRANMLSAAARAARPLVYVPNSLSNTVDVIDPRTYKVIRHFSVGSLPQHVTPAWNLKTLYVLNDMGNSLTTIDPRTGKPGRSIRVADPYNMYFTPDGRFAIVVAERLHRLDFRNARTFKPHRSVRVPCAGVDHMDFSADGRYLIASCEFSGQLVKVDVQTERVVGLLTLPRRMQGMRG